MTHHHPVGSDNAQGAGVEFELRRIQRSAHLPASVWGREQAPITRGSKPPRRRPRTPGRWDETRTDCCVRLSPIGSPAHNRTARNQADLAPLVRARPALIRQCDPPAGRLLGRSDDRSGTHERVDDLFIGGSDQRRRERLDVLDRLIHG